MGLGKVLHVLYPIGKAISNRGCNGTAWITQKMI